MDSNKVRSILNSTASTNKEGTIIVDGGCDTTVCGQGWKVISQDPIRKANLVGNSEDILDYGVPIGTAVTATELPMGKTILLRVNEAALLTRNAKSLLSCQQVRDYGVLVNDVPQK